MAQLESTLLPPTSLLDILTLSTISTSAIGTSVHWAQTQSEDAFYRIGGWLFHDEADDTMYSNPRAQCLDYVG